MMCLLTGLSTMKPIKADLFDPKLSSPLDSMPAIEKPKAIEKKEPINTLPYGSTPDRPAARTPVRPKDRVRVRYAFEFYQDQIAKLKEMRLTALNNGDDKFSMSEFVRDAVEEKLNNVDRTPVREYDRTTDRPVED